MIYAALTIESHHYRKKNVDKLKFEEKKIIFPRNARTAKIRSQQSKSTANIDVSYQFGMLPSNGSNSPKFLQKFEKYQKFQR